MDDFSKRNPNPDFHLQYSRVRRKKSSQSQKPEPTPISGDSDSCKLGSSSSSEPTHEKESSNKRKSLSEGSVNVAVQTVASSLTEFPRYELLEEKLDNKVKEYLLADWNDPIACQFEEILIENFYAIFGSAIKKIAENGYSEEVAQQAVLRSGFPHGVKDPMSNIVENALSCLRGDEGSDNAADHLFENVQNLVEYTMLETVNVLMEVQPSLSVAEAMWCLLISDLNISRACEIEGDIMKSFLGTELAMGSSSEATESQTSDANFSNPRKLNVSMQSNPDSQKPQSETPLEVEDSSNVYDAKPLRLCVGTTIIENTAGVAKKYLSGSSKRDVHRQRILQMERFRARMSDGAFKNKVSGSLLEKKEKPWSDSSGVNVKHASSKKNSTALAKAHATSSSAVAQAPVKHNVSVDDSKVSKSLPPETKPASNPQNTTLPSSSTPDYFSGMPYDKSKGKYVPQDEKDELILALVARKQALQKEIQSWTNWTNDKIMQAARRLNKDKEELKALRQEKEEAEKVSTEKQLMVENAMKRLTEMEHALGNTTEQIEVANSTISELDQDNLALKKDMEAVKLQTMVSTKELQDVVFREQEIMKKVQSCEFEKRLMLEKLATAKHKAAELRKRLEKANGRYNQTEAPLKQEEKEIEKILNQASAIRKEREQLEAEAKEEEDKLRQKADHELQKCKDDIKMLEQEISKLSMESESSKIAELRRGINSSSHDEKSSDKKHKYYLIPNVLKRLPVFQEISRAERFKQQDKECVMCMAADKTVVFLPCAHQVLCENCSKQHEQQGMNDCPSCRAPIQMRFAARFVKK